MLEAERNLFGNESTEMSKSPIHNDKQWTQPPVRRSKKFHIMPFKMILNICLLKLLLLMSTMMSHVPRGSAFRARSVNSYGLQHRIRIKNLSMQSPVTRESGDASLLEPAVVSSRVFDTDKRPIILFDGVCNLCNNAVNLALDWDPNAKLRFSALQSNVGKSLLENNGRKADDISSIVLVTKDGAFVKSDAVLKITEELTPLSLLPLKPAAMAGRFLLPKLLRDIIYDSVADNRYRLMGMRNECRFDADGEFEDRFVDDDIALKKP